MNKNVETVLDNLEKSLIHGYLSKKEALEMLNRIDLTNIDFKKYKKIKKFLKVK